MNNLSKLFLMFGAITMLGAGCISFSGGGASSGENYGVWKSIDGALTWQKMNALPTAQGVGDLSGVNVHEITFDPSDRFAIYMGSIAQGMFYSYDGAASWMRVREQYLREGRIRAVAVDPSDKCTLYVSRGQRISKSTDCGRTFDTEVFVDSRTQVVITDIEVDWFNTNNVYISNSNGEVLKTSDAGATWRTVYRGGGSANDIAIDNSDSRIVMVTTSKRGIKRSVDGGENWEDILTDGYESYPGIEDVREIQQTLDGSTYWIASEKWLAMSKDKGATWKPVPLLTEPARTDITAMALDPRDGNHVVYVSGQTVSVTVNGGTKWSTEEMPTYAAAWEMVIDPVDSSTIYMGLRAPVEESSGLF